MVGTVFEAVQARLSIQETGCTCRCIRPHSTLEGGAGNGEAAGRQAQLSECQVLLCLFCELHCQPST